MVAVMLVALPKAAHGRQEGSVLGTKVRGCVGSPFAVAQLHTRYLIESATLIKRIGIAALVSGTLAVDLSNIDAS
jgi:hypothetical protein